VTDTLGELLGRWMTTHGKTQADIARIAEVSDSTVGRWISGRTKTLTVDTIRKLVDHTELTVPELLVAAGMFTREQLEAAPPPTDPRTLSNDALLAYVRERMVEPPGAGGLGDYEEAQPRTGPVEPTGRRRGPWLIANNGQDNNGQDGEEPEGPDEDD
jgi:transcriptional regulator with XRE-family HTH domain